MYRYNFNSKKIEKYNIFSHYNFLNAVKDLKKKKLSKEEFAEELYRELMYYFWCKCEHEIVLTTFPPYIKGDELDRLNCKYVEFAQNNNDRTPKILSVGLETEVKVDVYSQVMLNWHIFLDYVYSGSDDLDRKGTK